MTIELVVLGSNMLEGALSEGLSQLVNLKDLALDGNKLTQLPESIHLLASLEALKVENNQLRSLPAQIGRRWRNASRVPGNATYASFIVPTR